MKTKRRNISITNKRVSDKFDEIGKGKVSKFIEDCVLYYLDNVNNEYITRDQIKGIIFDYLGDASGFRSEKNNTDNTGKAKQLENDILGILNL